MALVLIKLKPLKRTNNQFAPHCKYRLKITIAVSVIRRIHGYCIDLE